MTEDEAKAWLRESVGADARAITRLDRLIDLLIVENDQQNLISRGSINHIWQRHVIDSAQLLVVPRETVPDGLWLDLGTGAGFPGLVIAILQPERPMILLDSRPLRTAWLERAAKALDLDNVRVAQTKAERFELSVAANVISARAFAPLDRLLALSTRFSTPDTLWLLPKGSKARHEVGELPGSLRHTFHVEQSMTDPDAGVIAGRVLGQVEPARVHGFSQRKKPR